MNRKIVTGNVYDKYHSRNPIARKLMNGFLKHLANYVQPLRHMQSILEVGCGEGYLAEFVHRLRPDVDIYASDIDDRLFSETRDGLPRVNFVAADVYRLPWPDDSFDLVIAAEVLEHLENPTAAFAEIRRVAKRYILASVPNEPLWRFLNCLRGHYLRTAGNTPGHIQHWSKAKFKRFIEARCQVVKLSTPFPWTMVLAQKSASVEG